jgi:pimeloyl-ACP methyl ester carboxylesterase
VPTIDIADQRIHYIQQGSGIPLLIFSDHIHTSQAYKEELDYFCGRYQVVSFDYPGTGRSTRAVKYQDEVWYDLWGYWSDIGTHLLMELGIEECYVMGTGGGSLAAIHFAGALARMHGLKARGVIADSFLAKWNSQAMHRQLNGREHYYRRQADSLQQQHGDDWRQVVDGDTSFLRTMADQGGYELPTFILNSITCPVLLTGNLQDAMTPDVAGEYARLAGIIPDCSIYLASKSGHPYKEHPWMWSDPKAFRMITDLFLSKAEKTTI